MNSKTMGQEGADANVGWRILRTAMPLTLALVLGLSVLVSAQDVPADREAKIKAAYLYQFIGYVQWPNGVFDDGQSLVIGVAGDDPVNRYLRLIVKKRTAAGRELVYKQITTADEARLCHIVFVSDKADEKTREAIIRCSRGVPVLLVGEDAEFVDTGGVISFIIVENNVRLRLSVKAALSHKLKVSSQLAKLADVVN